MAYNCNVNLGATLRSMENCENMNIIEAARSTGASRDTIRFYEKLGIIHPARNPSNNYRDYSDHDIYMIIMARLPPVRAPSSWCCPRWR